MQELISDEVPFQRTMEPTVGATVRIKYDGTSWNNKKGVILAIKKKVQVQIGNKARWFWESSLEVISAPPEQTPLCKPAVKSVKARTYQFQQEVDSNTDKRAEPKHYLQYKLWSIA